MDSKAFIRWALDDARTVEERYTTELLVEQGEIFWCLQRQVPVKTTFAERMERNRERELNPAYDPRYSEESLIRAAEHLVQAKDWNLDSQRPIRSVEPLRFLTSLESFAMHRNSEVADYSPLAELPALRVLKIGWFTNPLGQRHCEDYTFLARCTALRELMVGFNAHWPDFTGLGSLSQLETLTLSGNLLAMPRGITFPNVRRAYFHCHAPRGAECCRPPATPRLRNPHPRRRRIARWHREDAQLAQSHAARPLPQLRTAHRPLGELTWLNVEPVGHLDTPHIPRDVAPLARLPKLHYFGIGSKLFTPENRCMPDMPRDYSPLVEAPALHEVAVRACPPVEMEVAAISAGLLPWDDLFLAPEPRPLPTLRMIVAPDSYAPPYRDEHRLPGETGLIDEGLRECEERWVSAYIRNILREYIGHRDWGTLGVTGLSHAMHLTIESFEVVEKLPDILDIVRQALARLRHEYIGTLNISLRIPPPKPSAAQKQLETQFRTAEDEWDFKQRQRDHLEYLDRLHQLELKQQQGQEIDPGEFSPTEPDPYPERPSESDEEDEDEGDGEGNIAIEKKPDPPAHFFDDEEHPLARNYYLWARFTLEEVWFQPRNRGLAIHLMQREPDLDIPDEEKKE